MNDMTGRIVPDTSTGLPYPSYSTDTDELNVRLTWRVHELEDKLSKLEAENAELREKCMTRFARIKNVANADDMAQMLHKLYMTGYLDALYYKETGKDDPTYNNVSDLSHYLQEIGKI